MTPKMAGLLVAAALATGWLLGSETAQDAAESAARRVPPGVRPVGSPPSAPYTQRLRERLKEPATPQRGRNPFTYGSRSLSPAAPTRRATRADDAAEPARDPVPPAPRITLSGIATSRDNGETVLTAIVIDNGVMVFAKAGDKLSNGHTVVRIEEMSMTLADANGVTQTLRLP